MSLRTAHSKILGGGKVIEGNEGTAAGVVEWAGFTPGPWFIGSLSGMHLEHGKATCAWCDHGEPLVRIENRKTTNPARFADVVHFHLSLAGPEDSFRTIVAADGTEVVGMCDYEDGGVCTTHEDALLIAAAPDLLAALEDAVRDLSQWDEVGRGTEALMLAAIRKARGQTNDAPLTEQPKSESQPRSGS